MQKKLVYLYSSIVYRFWILQHHDSLMNPTVAYNGIFSKHDKSPGLNAIVNWAFIILVRILRHAFLDL